MESFNDKLKKEINKHVIKDKDFDISVKSSKDINSNTVRNYLRNMYLEYGYIVDPAKEYHLEFSVSQIKISNMTVKALKYANVEGKISTRDKKIIVYIKNKNNIIKFLDFVSANKSKKVFIDTVKNKEITSYVNRYNNFDVANTKRVGVSVANQLKDIEVLLKHINKKDLDEEILNIINCRIKHKDLPLSDLSKKIGNISKTTLKRRFDKIHLMAKDYLNKK